MLSADPPKPLSKHEQRRLRREAYYRMIDGDLTNERHFMGRIIDVLNRKGIDYAHDGRFIKANWWHYMSTRVKSRRINALACLYLLDCTYRSIHPVIYVNIR